MPSPLTLLLTPAQQRGSHYVVNGHGGVRSMRNDTVRWITAKWEADIEA